MNLPNQNEDKPSGKPKRESLLAKVFLDPEAAPTNSDAGPRKPSGLAKIFLDPDPKLTTPPPPPPCAVRFDETKFFWAMQDLPIEEAVKHSAICGCIGSGKTTAMDLLLQSIAPRFRAGWKRPEQLVVFDGKGDLVPKLAGLDLDVAHENVWLLNPFDERTAVWHFSEAVDQPAMARHLAGLLCPEEKGSTAPFFAQAAQQLVFGVILALNRVAPSQWTFRDLLLALETKERITAITEKHARARAVVAGILNDERHALGVLSTLATKLARFEEVAALWHTAPAARRFSVPKFLRGPGVLILGHDPVFKDSIWPINAILLKALTQEILRGRETREPRYWFVLDEFRAMENVDCLRELLNLGRSKGAAVTIGTQSIDGLVEIYGEQGANSILEQCTNKSFLRAGGPKTAEWAERFINKTRRVEHTVTKTSGSSGSSTAVQYSLHDRPILTAGYFLDLDLPQPGGQFEGVHDVPSQGSFLITQRPFAEVMAWRKPPSDIPSVQRRTNVQDQHLQAWSEAEEARFFGSLPPPVEAPPAANKTSPPPAAGAQTTPPPGKVNLPSQPANDHDPGLYGFDPNADPRDL